MGCASSNQSRCKYCQNAYSPLHRSYSVPIHHHPLHKGDSYHVVALTSTTLGSLKLDSLNQSGPGNDNCHENPMSTNSDDSVDRRREFSVEVSIAKSSSEMIDERIPRSIPVTSSRTPPGEPETINTWELMEGLDDCCPLRLPQIVDRSFSFHAVSNYAPLDQSKPKLLETYAESPKKILVQTNGIDSNMNLSPSSAPIDQLKPKLQERNVESPNKMCVQTKGINSETNSASVISSSSPLDQLNTKLQEGVIEGPKMWVQTKDIDSDTDSSPIISSFDPEIISTFRKALEELSPIATVNLNRPDFTDDVMDNMKVDNVVIIPTKCPPRGEEKVVIYFTSLRGVRKTYEDCCHVRVILKGLGVRVDERDVSMHYGFREELKELLGDGFSGGVLPKVFINGRYIGGAEEIRQLNEEGELEKVLRGCTVVEESGNGGGVCEVCGDIRFVPCERCSGSCKIFYEESDDDDWEGEEGGEFQRCPDCNENGIVLCHICCY
ncbi:hypothetical protein GIB67_005020 [Kingdonia uniflora]|uniref:Glutaredoxin domain-containing protein n=1 Tax=Kingdonia uniflora TaxID=39325 RepID=A0A7J7NNG1_9MAGN|nr:hypothetical protein GIB67_005020 [Kingdonia uniflora]